MNQTIHAEHYTGEQFRKALEEGKNEYDVFAESFRQKADKDPFYADMATYYESMSAIRKSTGERRILDSGIFNGEIEAYCTLALRHAGVDTETEKRVLSGLHWAFDEYTAEEALEASQSEK